MWATRSPVTSKAKTVTVVAGEKRPDKEPEAPPREYKLLVGAPAAADEARDGFYVAARASLAAAAPASRRRRSSEPFAPRAALGKRGCN